MLVSVTTPKSFPSAIPCSLVHLLIGRNHMTIIVWCCCKTDVCFSGAKSMAFPLTRFTTKLSGISSVGLLIWPPRTTTFRNNTSMNVRIWRPTNNYTLLFIRIMFKIFIFSLTAMKWNSLHFFCQYVIHHTHLHNFSRVFSLVFQLFNFNLSCLNYRFLSFGIRQYVIVWNWQKNGDGVKIIK